MVKAQHGFYNQKQIHDPNQKKATQVHARYGPTKTKPKAGHHNKTSKHAALPAKNAENSCHAIAPINKKKKTTKAGTQSAPRVKKTCLS